MSKISIRKDTKQRINAFAAYTDENGTRYPTVPPEVFEWVEPPAPPAEYLANPDHYYVTEQDDAPFVVYTRKSDEQIADARWVAIKALRDAKTQTGGYAVGSNWFHSDTFSRTQQMGLVMMGGNVPVGLRWKTMDGVFVPMTPTLAQQIFAAAAQQDAALFAHAEALKADPLADIATGWPATWQDVQQDDQP